MAHIEISSDVALDEPTFVDGLPGVGLVGKIAADHLVETFDMVEHAVVHCDGLPEVAVYGEADYRYRPPVRLYADEQRDLLVLQSDVPVSPNAADEFAGCLSGWLNEHDALALFLTGMAADKDGVPEMYGVANDGATSILEAHEIPSPTENGVISGPTGALLHQAQASVLASVGLVVEANPNFPDPEAARVLLVDGVAPVADVTVETDRLVEQAEEISEAREQLAKRMQGGGEESTSARPMGMYQ